MKGLFALTALTLVASCGGGGSGSSGGDLVRGYFLMAKDHGSEAVLNSTSKQRLGLTSKVVDDWVEKNKSRLAEEVRLSKQIWTEQETPTCARTERSPKADILFSIPSCRKVVTTKDHAAFVLIHEAVHHFGVEDETFADQVAYSIVGDEGEVSEDHLSISHPPEAPLDIEFNEVKHSRWEEWQGNAPGVHTGSCIYSQIDYQYDKPCKPIVRVKIQVGFEFEEEYSRIRVRKKDKGYQIYWKCILRK